MKVIVNFTTASIVTISYHCNLKLLLKSIKLSCVARYNFRLAIQMLWADVP